MDNFICQYCNKEYSNKSNLTKHQTTTKKCLNIQKSMKINTNNFLCQYCDKEFVGKDSMIKHENICKNKKYEVQLLQSTLEKCQTELEKYKIENKKLQEEVTFLKATNQVYNEISKNNHSITINNKTNNNYSKNITFNSSLNLNDIDTISNIINNKYDIEHLLQGQKGIAHFILENFLKDDDGNLKYICSDPSRKVFNYQTEEGIVEKDLSANKLTNCIVAGGIKEKTINLACKWYTKSDYSIDHDKFRIAVKNQESILEIDQDNNSFKNELTVMTTK